MKIIHIINSLTILLAVLVLWPKFKNNIKYIYEKILMFHYILLIFSIFILQHYWYENNLNFLQNNININFINIKNLLINFSLNIDSISLVFIILTIFIFTLCIFYDLDKISYKYKKKNIIIWLILLELILILIFSVSDIILFYCFFEISLIPMIFIIGFWGNRFRKIKAIFYFFIFTLFGSILLFGSFLYIVYTKNTSDYYLLLCENFTENEQKYLWLAFFFGFGVKIPIIPFHIWLPEAHVEAPTIGSVILAALLLKLGGYGLLKFCLTFFPFANIYYNPLILTICTISIIYSTLTAIRQNDLKRIIAYSSISHMNFVVLGIFSLNFEGIFGSILLMLGHGIISSALFFLIGILYERHNTRLIKYFSGLLQIMPIFSSILFFFIISNISFPGTANFVGEFLILFGLIKNNTLITIIISISLIFTLIYNILLYNKLCMGNLKNNSIKHFQDINLKEFILFIPLIFLNLYIGIKPEIFYDLFKNNIFNLLLKYKI